MMILHKSTPTLHLDQNGVTTVTWTLNHPVRFVGLSTSLPGLLVMSMVADDLEQLKTPVEAARLLSVPLAQRWRANSKCWLELKNTAGHAMDFVLSATFESAHKDAISEELIPTANCAPKPWPDAQAQSELVRTLIWETYLQWTYTEQARGLLETRSHEWPGEVFLIGVARELGIGITALLGSTEQLHPKDAPGELLERLKPFEELRQLFEDTNPGGDGPTGSRPEFKSEMIRDMIRSVVGALDVPPEDMRAAVARTYIGLCEAMELNPIDQLSEEYGTIGDPGSTGAEGPTGR